MMKNHQLHPLEVNTETEEPFLRLRRHKNIILTPPRWDDGPQFVPYLNDPHVYEWIQGPPFPYTLEDAEHWLKLVKPPSDAVLQELERATEKEEVIVVGHCPVNIIREVHEDGTETFIGDIDIRRCGLGELLGSDGPSVLDWEEGDRNAQLNIARTVGDPEIVWDIGDYLASTHHGQGIMSDALETLIHEWAVPRMGVRRILAVVFEGNGGSVRVFEKNGFKLSLTSDNHLEARGKRRSVHILEWRWKE